MKIWIYINGAQQGPYALEELRQMGITTDTPVWYDGLDQWSPAGKAPKLQALFEETPEADNNDDATAQQTDPIAPSEPDVPNAPDTPDVSDVPAVPDIPDVPVAVPPAIPVIPPRPTTTPAEPEPEPAPFPRPKTWLWLALLLTICCCSPLGLAAIFTGSAATSRYDNGDYVGAKKAANATEWLIIIAITFAFITLPFGLISASIL